MIVLNKNDAPVILKSTFRMPEALPYKLSEVSAVVGSGTTINDMLGSGTVKDDDGDQIGKLPRS